MLGKWNTNYRVVKNIFFLVLYQQKLELLEFKLHVSIYKIHKDYTDFGKKVTQVIKIEDRK